jgi:hypothetical protein
MLVEWILGTLITGVAATAVVDAWMIARKAWFGTPPPDWGHVGRWFGHMASGRFVHESIAASAPVRGERLIGWIAHYAIGIAFAALLVIAWGAEWLSHPTIVPALIVGIGGVAAPLLVMQPAMGAGIAASRTPRPNLARLHSVVTHAIFGLGLFAGGWASRFL